MRALLVIFSLFLAGCGPASHFCDNTSGDSFICETVVNHLDMGKRLSQLMIDINTPYVIYDNNGTSEIRYFIRVIRKAMDEPISYRALIYTIFRCNENSGAIVISRHIRAFESDKIISGYDRRLILELLQDIDERVNLIIYAKESL